MTAGRSAFLPAAHDHGACVAATLEAAQRLCAAHGARLTEGRRRILEIVAARHGAIGAYDIIDALGAAGGRRPAPISVYRALDFLIEHGLVHRLASRNAYVACRQPGAPHAAQFLVCAGCGSIGEIADAGVAAAVTLAARGEGFAVRTPVIEIEGVCPGCGRDAAEAGPRRGRSRR